MSLSSGVNRSGRKADKSPPFCAEVNNEVSLTSIPSHAFMAGIRHFYLYSEENSCVFEHVSLFYETSCECCNKAADVGKPRLRGRARHCCSTAIMNKQFKHICGYTRFPVMDSEYKFFTTKKNAMRTLPLLTAINGHCG